MIREATPCDLDHCKSDVAISRGLEEYFAVFYLILLPAVGSAIRHFHQVCKLGHHHDGTHRCKKAGLGGLNGTEPMEHGMLHTCFADLIPLHCSNLFSIEYLIEFCIVPTSVPMTANSPNQPEASLLPDTTTSSDIRMSSMPGAVPVDPFSVTPSSLSHPISTLEGSNVARKDRLIKVFEGYRGYFDENVSCYYPVGSSPPHFRYPN